MAKDGIAKLLERQHVPSLHLQIDLWSAPFTREDMLGVYVSYLDEDMRAVGHLLAARHVRPTPELHQKCAELILMFLEDVAAQYDFNVLQHVFSMTTDAGANIRRLAEKLLDRQQRIRAIDARLREVDELDADAADSDDSDMEEDEFGEAGGARTARRRAERARLEAERAWLVKLVGKVGRRVFWLWCKCHQAHLAVVDAAGVDLSESKKQPTNPIMQKLVLDLLEFVNAVNSRTTFKIAYEAALLASAGRKEKMRTVVKQRWAALAALLGRVLKNLKAVKAACRAARVACPFAEREAELHELYSVLRPVTKYLERAQASMARTRRPVIVSSHYDLVGLRFNQLNKEKPLTLLQPETDEPVVEAREVEVDGVRSQRQYVVARPHEDLSQVARAVRGVLAAGFDQRGLKAQYTEVEYPQRSADMAMFLYPPMAGLSYVGVLGGIYGADAGTVAGIKGGVKRRVVDMVALQIEGERAAEAEKAAAAGTMVRPPAVPLAFQKVVNPKGSASHYLGLGLLPDEAEPARTDGSGQQERSAAEEAEALVDEYVKKATALNPKVFVAEYPPDHVNDWWRGQPDNALKAVARAILGQAASSGPLENAFSTGRDVCSRRRSSLAPWRAEMLLVCACMRRYITLTPDDVDEIAADEIEQHLPCRFTREELITDLKEFGDHLMTMVHEASAAGGEEWEGETEEGCVDDLGVFSAWSSLAAWGVDEFDLDLIAAEVDGLVLLPPAPATDST